MNTPDDWFKSFRETDEALELSNLGRLFLAYEMTLFLATMKPESDSDSGRVWAQAQYLRANLAQSIVAATKAA